MSSLDRMKSTISIQLQPSEPMQTIMSLLYVSFTTVFNNRDEESRNAAIRTIYADDVVWYGFQGTVDQGIGAFTRRVADVVYHKGAGVLKPRGVPHICHNMGTLMWMGGPPGHENAVEGGDVVIVEGGKIKVMWTYVDKFPAPGEIPLIDQSEGGSHEASPYQQ